MAAAGIGADGIATTLAPTLGIGFFIVVTFFDVGILHSWVFCCGGYALRIRHIDLMTCKLPREAEREVSKSRRASLRRKFFAEIFARDSRA